MGEMVFINDGQYELSKLLEGYLYGLGEVCHDLFGRRGEEAVYRAVGSFFLKYLKEKMNVVFDDSEPWKRYCHIVEVFTGFGFYSYVELKELPEDKYWMLESGQYAGKIWNEQKSWERGMAPCPLWALILHSLSEIGYTIVLDEVSFNEKTDGYESVFHFEKMEQVDESAVEHARKELRSVLLPICAHCKKIRDERGRWVDIEEYFSRKFEARFTHGICGDCAEKVYPQLQLDISDLYVH